MAADNNQNTQNMPVSAQANMWTSAVRDRVLATIVPAEENAAKDLAAAKKILAKLQPDGTWPDIDYASRQRGNWPVGNHVARMFAMARAYDVTRRAGAPDRAFLDGIHLAAENWFREDRKCPNWWWNEIGVPQSLGCTYLILGNDAAPAQFARTIEVLKRSNWQKWTGQNLVWGTGIQVVRGLLEKNDQTVQQAFTRMFEEVRIEPQSGEGIMADGSFHQHGPQLYSGGYGLGFTNDIGRYITYSWGTPAQISQDKLDIYVKYLLDGQQWMIFDTLFDYSAAGREITRKGKKAFSRDVAGNDPSSGYRVATNLWHIVTDISQLPNIPRQRELLSFSKALSNPEQSTFSGNRYFWCSDYMVQRTPQAMFSVRTFSSRTLNSEEVNSENRKGHHLADGCTYIYRTGNEYANIIACWDWDKIPGTTTELSPQGNNPAAVISSGVRAPKDGQPFVGGVSNGNAGMSVMSLKRGKLSAHKFWATENNIMICLGAGISSESNHDVLTTINQCQKSGNIERTTDESGNAMLWHDGIGYLVARGQELSVDAAARTGSWSDFGIGAKMPVTADIVTLGLRHGKQPHNAVYQYVVLNNVALKNWPDEAQKLQSAITVMQNDSAIQALRTQHNTYIAFWQAGEFRNGDGLSVHADHPCLILISQPESGPATISAANPESKKLALNVTLTRQSQSQKISFALPDGLFAGSTVTQPMPH